MQNRAEILTLLTEMRGRMDELERLVRFGPDYAVPTPLSYEEPEVEDLSPPGYSALRRAGLQGRTVLESFTPLDGFVQFACPEPATQCQVTTFDLSELHRNDAAPALGLSLTALGDKQEWFAFEFLNPGIDPKVWLWTEWVLKLSINAPGPLYSQFILGGEGDPVHVVIGAHEVNEFATFHHIRLDRTMIPADRLDALQRVRLVLSTGGVMMALNIYAFGVYGRR